MADTLESLEIEVVHHSAGAGTAIGAVTKAVNNLSGALTKVLPNLKEFGDSLGKIGAAFTFNDNRGSTFNKTIQNVKQTASKAATETAKVTEPMGEGMQMLISGATKYAVELNKAADAEVKMNEAFKSGDSQAAWRAREQMINATARAEKEYAKMHPVEEAAPTAVPLGQQNFIANANAIDLLKMKLEGLNAAMQKAFGEGDAQKAAQFRQQILQTEAALEKAQKAAEGAGKATKEAANGVKHLAKESSKAKSPLENFISSLKRIAFYRIIRSIIKSITQAFQEGLQNAYAFSQGITTEGHRFAEAMDSIKTAGSTMKNQLGSAFISLLAALAPVINALISLVTKLADALSQLFAAFTGKTYLKAADVPQQWADAASGAAKAAKEWKNQLLGFDEINRLEAPSDSNSGSGGGGGGGATYVDTPINEKYLQMVQKMRDFINSINFEPLLKSFDRLKASMKDFFGVLLDSGKWAWENVLKPLTHWTIEKLAPALVNSLASAFNLLTAILTRLAPVFEYLWRNIFQPLFSFIGSVAIKTLDAFNGLLQKLADLVGGKVSFKQFIDGLTDSEVVLGGVLIFLGVNGLIGLLSSLSTLLTGTVVKAITGFSAALSFLAANPVALVIAALAALVVAGVLVYKHWDELMAKAQELQQSLHDAAYNGKLDWMDLVYAIVWSITAPIEAIAALIGWIRDLIGWIKSALQGLGILQQENAKAQGTTTSGNYGGSHSSGNFAQGGYPDEGQLFIARENGAGPELVGTIGGRTAVASNNDILEGIRAGVFEAVSAAMTNGGNGDVSVKVYLDSREIKTGQQRLNRAMGVS